MYNVYCNKVFVRKYCDQDRCNILSLCVQCDLRKKMLECNRKLSIKPHTLISCMKYRFPRVGFKTLVRLVHNAGPDMEIELRKYYVALYGPTMEDYYAITRLNRKSESMPGDPILINVSYWPRILYISITQDNKPIDYERVAYVNLENYNTNITRGDKRTRRMTV